MAIWRKAASLGVALAAVLLGAAAPPADGLQTNHLEGHVGPYRIGMQLQVRDFVQFEDGHYYYAKSLTDIPLEGRIAGEHVTLRGTDGGVFELHLVDASHHAAASPGANEPLSFYTSTGLAGVWRRGSQSLPVELGFDWERKGAPSRLYGSVTDASDAEYEAMVRSFVDAVRQGNRAAAAARVSYPLQVNRSVRGRVRQVHLANRAALLAQWNSIFTPATVMEIAAAIPHELFIREGMACLGSCVVYFDDRGARTINVSN